MHMHLLHLKAGAAEQSDHLIVGYDDESPLRRFDGVAQRVATRRINWSVSFARRDLPCAAYTLTHLEEEGAGTRYVFTRLDLAEYAKLPESVSFLLERGSSDGAAGNDRDVVARDTVRSVLRVQKVADMIARTRREVRPLLTEIVEVVTDRGGIERLHAECAPEYATAFKSAFLDCWTEESFALIQH